MFRLALLALLPILFALAPTGRPRLVDQETQARYRAMLPRIEGDSLAGLYARDLIFYTERQVPRAYQNPFNSIRSHLESAWYNVSADKPREPFGNGNREFPWRATAGMDDADRAGTVKFLSLPPGAKLKMRRVSTQCQAWEYPAGTVVGELLCIQHPKGDRWVPFELRLLAKGASGWMPEVYRPFPTEDDYAAAVRGLGFDPGIHDGQVVELANRHPKEVIRVAGMARALAPLPPSVVDDLLSYPFRPVTVAGEWNQDDQRRTFPAVDADYHIVPRGYRGGLFRVRRNECLACHQTAFAEVREFDPKREWYGRVRGCDGIFSFNPFDPACISHNGSHQPLWVRGELRDVVD